MVKLNHDPCDLGVSYYRARVRAMTRCVGVAKARARASKSSKVHLVTRRIEVLESQGGPNHRLEMCVWLRLELGLARATRSIWSLLGGIREPGWAESPDEDV